MLGPALIFLTPVSSTQLCPVVESVLGVVNELLGTVLSELGSNPLLFAPPPTPPSHYTNERGYQGN